MDLPKFLSILISEALYFPSSVVLRREDRFEGQTPPGMLEEMRRIAENPEGHLSEGSFLRTVPKDLRAVVAGTLFRSNAAVQTDWSTYISCWHMNDDESDAMWKVYSKDVGVAVRSTIGGLKLALEAEPRAVYIGEVQYADPNKHQIHVGNAFNYHLWKRRAFAHEREVRAILSFAPEALAPEGRSARIDVSRLIERVFVSPKSPEWFFDLVRTVSNRLGYNFPVERSGM